MTMTWLTQKDKQNIFHIFYIYSLTWLQLRVGSLGWNVIKSRRCDGKTNKKYSEKNHFILYGFVIFFFLQMSSSAWVLMDEECDCGGPPPLFNLPPPPIPPNLPCELEMTCPNILSVSKYFFQHKIFFSWVTTKTDETWCHICFQLNWTCLIKEYFVQVGCNKIICIHLLLYRFISDFDMKFPFIVFLHSKGNYMNIKYPKIQNWIMICLYLSPFLRCS